MLVARVLFVFARIYEEKVQTICKNCYDVLPRIHHYRILVGMYVRCTLRTKLHTLFTKIESTKVGFLL